MDDLTECDTIDYFILRRDKMTHKKVVFNRFGLLLGVFLQARYGSNMRQDIQGSKRTSTETVVNEEAGGVTH